MRNRQPVGGCIALGSSPTMPSCTLDRSVSGSAVGADSIRPLVYGWAGRRYTSSAGPISTSLPRYMTPMWFDRYLTTDRSWEMNM